MVKTALWPNLGRGTAWGFFWFSVVLAIGCVIYGLRTDSRFLLGAGFLLSALWYLTAIQWMDRNRAWWGRSEWSVVSCQKFQAKQIGLSSHSSRAGSWQL